MPLYIYNKQAPQILSQVNFTPELATKLASRQGACSADIGSGFTARCQKLKHGEVLEIDREFALIALKLPR